MTNQNNVIGTGRQAHTTPQGVYLERKYIYLAPDLWQVLHSISHKSGLSASQYLASILTADNGKSENKGNSNDHISPSY